MGLLIESRRRMTPPTQTKPERTVEAAELPRTAEVLGTPLALTDYEGALDWIDAAVESRRGGYVCVAPTHTVVASHEDPELRAAVLLGDSSEERRAIHSALRALAAGEEPASQRAEDAVRRSLVETLRHGDRLALVRSLDDTLLGLKNAPRLAETA